MYGWVVIDEELRSHGRHGKDQFVYPALSLGSQWHFDLYCAAVDHGLLIWSLSKTIQPISFSSLQCNVKFKNLAEDQTVLLTQR